ncbi:Nucleoporin nup84, partial [Marasmius crinis-equi]
MSETLYSSYSEVLLLAQSMKDDLEGLLDPEAGLAPRLRQICRDQYVLKFSAGRLSFLHAPPTRIEDATGEASSEELDLLKLEENTWALLQAVMP